MLHPIGAVIAGHYKSKRKTVQKRQVVAVHAVGQHHLAVAGMVDVERLDEIRRRVHHRPIHAVEGHLLRALLHAGHVEHGFQRHAAPARIAHRAITQLTAGDARLEKATAVSRALIDGNEFDRPELPDFLERQFQRMADLAFDFQGELVRIDVERHPRQVIANKERIVGRDRPVVENGEGRLELRRPAGQADHRALLRISHQRPFAVVERQRRGIEREGCCRSEAGPKRRQAGAFYQLSSIEHQASSRSFFR